MSREFSSYNLEKSLAGGPTDLPQFVKGITRVEVLASSEICSECPKILKVTEQSDILL